MGNFFSYQGYFVASRVIDGINQVHVGVIAPIDSNPYSSQAIKIGLDGKIRRLENFIETSNCLKFEFEADTVLTLSRRDKEIILGISELETNIKIIKLMDSVCREIFKPIMWGNLSTELDKISNFIHPNFDDLQTEIGKEIALKLES